MSVLDTLKSAAAIGGSIVGIVGGGFAVGAVVGAKPAEAKIDAHLQPEVIHAEAAKRIESMQHEIRQAESAAREAAEESRKTREALDDLTGVHRAGVRR